MSIFSSIEDFFEKVFKKLPSETVVALSTVQTIAPLVEAVIALSDPSAETEVAPILQTIQTDLGTVSATLSSGSTASLPSLIASIQSNLPSLISAGKITDPVSVAKATALATTITSELTLVLNALK